MKSMLFVMRYFTINLQDNLSIKFRNQIKAAQNIGLDVWYVVIEDNSIFLVNKNTKYKLVEHKIKHQKNLINSIKLYIVLFKSIVKCYEIKNNFDFVYIRNVIFTPSMIYNLKKIKNKGSKIIVEIPTFPSNNEEASERKLIRRVLFKYNKISSLLKNRYVDFYTLIGEKSESYMGKPALNIENGICLDLIPLRNPKVNCNEIHCLALASMSRWQGYDRFIEGLHEYKKRGGRENIILHLVGDEGDGSLEEWIRLSSFYHLDKSVVYEGPLYGEKLNSLVDTCDIGVATLAGYRKEMGISSTLKIRDFMARGLPFIHAVEDSALNGNLNFVMKIPDKFYPVNMDDVIKFAEYTRNNQHLVDEMRNYARKTMTWEEQFSEIIEWIEAQ